MTDNSSYKTLTIGTFYVLEIHMTQGFGRQMELPTSDPIRKKQILIIDSIKTHISDTLHDTNARPYNIFMRKSLSLCVHKMYASHLLNNCISVKVHVL